MSEPVDFDPTPDIDGMADGRVTPPVEHQAYALLRRIVTAARHDDFCFHVGEKAVTLEVHGLSVNASEAVLLASLSQEGTTP